MKAYYNILKRIAQIEKPETGHVPAGQLAAFGPSFQSRNAAKSWLKKNTAPEAEYVILRFYALSVPDDLQLKKKKGKQ